MDQPYTRIKGGVCAASGFFGSAVSCGIKNPDSDRLDLGLVYSEFPCIARGAFTQNQVKAAPLQVTQNNLKFAHPRAIITNSGNANACTGPVGITDAKTMARSVAKLLEIKQREVAVCSTGVIGLPLPMNRINPHYEELVRKLGPKNGTDVARAIITSDTHEKQFAISLQIGDKRVRIGGCAKGAGMINPNMATMLCHITTDASIAEASLERAFKNALEHTFNRITIDGDTSTNDTVLVLANGAAGNKTIRRGSPECQVFGHALHFVMNKLAKAIVRDGERVSKFVTVKVVNARTQPDAKRVAQSVANSQLVKCSWNGNDPNWGRIIHAIGYSGARIKEEMIDIYYESKPACEGGMQGKTSPEVLRNIVSKPAFTITIDLNQGKAGHFIYTSDLSPEYVDFNRSEYAYWKQARKDGLV